MKHIKAGLIAVLFCCMGVASCSKEKLSVEDIESQAYADLQAQIRATVIDEDRQAEVLELTDRLFGNYRELRQALQQRRRELQRINADYDATREEFERSLLEHERRIPALQQLVTQSRVAFIGAMTTDEWADLAKAETKAVKQFAAILQSI